MAKWFGLRKHLNPKQAHDVDEPKMIGLVVVVTKGFLY